MIMGTLKAAIIVGKATTRDVAAIDESIKATLTVANIRYLSTYVASRNGSRNGLRRIVTFMLTYL